jgi:excisionase family DNA binding protein
MTLEISDLGQPRYLNATEVAEYLQVNRSTVHRMAASDPSMPALRLGKVLRFHSVALQVWLDSHTQRSRRSPTARSSQ